MYFPKPRAHAVPSFISSKILPLQMLYAEKVSSIMFDVSYKNAPPNICDFFTKANSKHKHETRVSSSGNYYVQTSRLNLNQNSFSRFGAKLWNAIPNEFRQLPKGAFKKNFHDFLLLIMAAEDDYVEVPILLQSGLYSVNGTSKAHERPRQYFCLAAWCGRTNFRFDKKNIYMRDFSEIKFYRAWNRAL